MMGLSNLPIEIEIIHVSYYNSANVFFCLFCLSLHDSRMFINMVNFSQVINSLLEHRFSMLVFMRDLIYNVNLEPYFVSVMLVKPKFYLCINVM